MLVWWLSDQLRLILPILVDDHAAIVAQWVQGVGILLQGILMGPLVEERSESWVLLPVLDATDDLADVVLKSWRLLSVCGRLWCIADLSEIGFVCVCLKRLNMLLVVACAG
jgi:hypothetical protein